MVVYKFGGGAIRDRRNFCSYFFLRVFLPPPDMAGKIRSQVGRNTGSSTRHLLLRPNASNPKWPATFLRIHLYIQMHSRTYSLSAYCCSFLIISRGGD